MALGSALPTWVVQFNGLFYSSMGLFHPARAAPPSQRSGITVLVQPPAMDLMIYAEERTRLQTQLLFPMSTFLYILSNNIIDSLSISLCLSLSRVMRS